MLDILCKFFKLQHNIMRIIHCDRQIRFRSSLKNHPVRSGYQW